MKARYIRVSSKGQKTSRQEAKLNPEERIFTDIISGTVPFNERPEAKNILYHIALKEVEQVSVSSIDRLGRNTIDILKTIQHFKSQNVNLHVDNLGLDSITPDGKPNYIFDLITSVMASLSQLEREQLRERQLEGIKEAKKDPANYKGRPVGTGKTAQQLVDENPRIVKYLKEGRSIRQTAKLAIDEKKETQKPYSPTHVQKVKNAMIELGMIKIRMDINR